ALAAFARSGSEHVGEVLRGLAERDDVSLAREARVLRRACSGAELPDPRTREAPAPPGEIPGYDRLAEGEIENRAGFPEYRHRATGLVFVWL
ncbi:hypothetical protein CVH10_20635, partial [Halomonas sp. ND22Bw]